MLELSDEYSDDNVADGLIQIGTPIELMILSAVTRPTPLARDCYENEGRCSTNHLGHFRLATQLWRSPRKAGSAGIVVLSIAGTSDRRFRPGRPRLRQAAIQQVARLWTILACQRPVRGCRRCPRQGRRHPRLLRPSGLHCRPARETLNPRRDRGIRCTRKRWRSDHLPGVALVRDKSRAQRRGRCPLREQRHRHD